ncbi:unnamed protein product [Urochloa decumbens]|uniref:Ubiquitin-like domain-containing protein n=1 Tax=Urochloa decumbens TaxID=240449 RepID=A0ABC9AL92_9POAL
MEEKKFQIFVRTDGAKVIVLMVEGSDTVSSLMAQLEDRLGNRPSEFFISHCGRPLYYHDAGTLADHKILKHSTLTVLYSHTRPRTYDLKVDTLRSLGVDVAHADDGAMARKMGIFVRDCMVPCGRGRRVRTIALDVEAGDTVASAMAQVQGKLGYPPRLQALYLHNGHSHRTRMLHDSWGTLADYKVKDGSVLTLDMNYDEARRIKEERESLPPAAQQQQEEISDDI